MLKRWLTLYQSWDIRLENWCEDFGDRLVWRLHNRLHK